MAWKAWVESIGQAMVKPSAVISKLISRIMAAASAMPAAVGCTPARGEKSRKMSPWMAASVAPPSTLPSTMAEREAGEASTVSRKPSLRSWISDIMEKIAVKSTIMTIEPGKK